MTPSKKYPPAPPLLCQEHSICPADSAEIDCFVREIYLQMEPSLTRQRFVNPEYRISLSLREAVVNAWQHGNNKNRSKTVTVRWRLQEELVLEVLDQGSGFDFQAIADPRAEENVCKPCGRGIAIITYLADQISWQDQGRHLLVSFGRVSSREKKNAPPV